MRGLAMTGPKRSAALPELPTVAEAGVPGYEATTWTGIVAPAGLPRPLVVRLNAELNKVVASPAFREKVAPIGSEPHGRHARAVPGFHPQRAREVGRHRAALGGEDRLKNGGCRRIPLLDGGL